MKFSSCRTWFWISANVLLAVLLPRVMVGADDDAGNAEPLPAGAVCRLGSDAFVTRDGAADLAYSPDGKLIAFAEYNTPTPYVVLIDAKSGLGRQVMRCNPKARGSVSCVAFSPDGKLLVAGDQTGALTFFDMAKRFAVFRRKLHKGSIEDIAFSNDGKLIATAGEDGKVFIVRADSRDVAQGKALAKGASREGVEFESGTLGVNSIEFSPDSSVLAAGIGRTGEVVVMDRRTGRVLRKLDSAGYDDGLAKTAGAGKLQIKPVKILKDGRTLLTAGNRVVPRTATSIRYGAEFVQLARVQLWDLETGRHIRDVSEPEENGFGYAAISPDERLIAVADFGRLTIRDTKGGKIRHDFSLPGSWGRPPAFSPDGKYVAMPLHESIALFDVESGMQLRSDSGIPRGSLASASWSADGSKMVTGYGDGFLRVWDASTGKVIWSELFAPVISPSGWSARPWFVAFSPDGQRVVAVGRRDDPEKWETGLIAAYDANTGKRLFEHVTKQEARNGAFSPDGRTIIATTTNGGIGDTHVYGIDARTGERRFVSPGEDVKVGLWSASQVRFSADSSAFYMSTGDSHILKYDTATGKVLSDVSIDWRTPEQKRTNRPRTAWLVDSAFLPDGKMLASSSDEYVYVWDSSTGEKKLQIRHPHDHGCRLAISPDGTLIATSDVKYSGDYGEDVMRFYDAQTGAEVGTLVPDGRRARILVFSPDGSKLFTGPYAGASLIWDVGRIGIRGGR